MDKEVRELYRVIYDGFDTLLSEGRFDFISWLLYSLVKTELSVRGYLAILTITLAAADKIEARKDFALSAYKSFLNKTDEADELMEGLW